jgi:myo-inositol-1(or 4)-monophosphatase
MSRELDIAIRAVQAGGMILREYFETPLLGEQKSDKSFVTKADKESEAAICAVLRSAFPDISILGEECGALPGTNKDCWVIDPLDGTANFMNAIPIFCVSLALVRGDEVVVAAIYNPITNSLFVAEKGEGAFWNDTPICVSDDTKKNVVITFGKSSKKEDGEQVNELFVAMQRKGFRVRYLGSAALELAYLARGGTDGYVNLGTSLWDYAAGVLLVQEAGGTITTLKGGKWKLGEKYFVASNGKIHEVLISETAPCAMA